MTQYQNPISKLNQVIKQRGTPVVLRRNSNGQDASAYDPITGAVSGIPLDQGSWALLGQEQQKEQQGVVDFQNIAKLSLDVVPQPGDLLIMGTATWRIQALTTILAPDGSPMMYQAVLE